VKKATNWKRIAHATAIFTMLAVTCATTAFAGKLDNLANNALDFVKIIVVAAFGWKTIEMLMKERYSMAWAIGLCGALVGGFLFLGEGTYTWAWNFIKGLVEG
jgi:glycerol uptake facilitator-like aquaporin